MSILIISDGKAGHFNQSIAFAKLKNEDYKIIEIKNNYKFLTYILDFFGIFINLYSINIKNENYKAVVSTGSSTYYTNKYLAKTLQIKSIAIMLPKGFKYSDFDFILANSHDNPPKAKNIIELPINLSTSEPKGFLQKQDKKSLGIIIGGNNKVFEMNKQSIKKELDSIFEKFSEYLKYITTSRRTPKEIDDLIKNYSFEYEVIYSKNPDTNPIPDFLNICDELFITIDSTSMLSEAKANSNANLHIIDLYSKKINTKYHKLADNILLIKDKFNYTPYLEKITL